MILPDYHLRPLGPTIVDPFDQRHVQPSSIDVHLDRHFQVRRRDSIPLNPAEPVDERFTRVTLERNWTQTILPGNFYLAQTFEKITVPVGMAARFEGKSSLGRLGLMTHITAGFIDPGFSGNITLELATVDPVGVVLHPGMKIGQVCFYEVDGVAERPYGAAGNHYQGQTTPQVCRMHEGWETVDVFGEDDR